jgi:hypothetical protein
MLAARLHQISPLAPVDGWVLATSVGKPEDDNGIGYAVIFSSLRALGEAGVGGRRLPRGSHCITTSTCTGSPDVTVNWR